MTTGGAAPGAVPASVLRRPVGQLANIRVHLRLFDPEPGQAQWSRCCLRIDRSREATAREATAARWVCKHLMLSNSRTMSVGIVDAASRICQLEPRRHAYPLYSVIARSIATWQSRCGFEHTSANRGCCCRRDCHATLAMTKWVRMKSRGDMTRITGPDCRVASATQRSRRR